MQSEEKELIVWTASMHPPLDSLDGSRLSILKPIPNHPFLDVKSLYKHYENFCDIFDYLTDTMYLCKGLQLMTNDFTIENATIYIINHVFMHMLLYHLEGIETSQKYDNICSLSCVNYTVGGRCALGIDRIANIGLLGEENKPKHRFIYQICQKLYKCFPLIRELWRKRVRGESH